MRTFEPVFFAYPENKTLDAVVAKYTAQKPVYDFVAPDDASAISLGDEASCCKDFNLSKYVLCIVLILLR